MTINTNSLNYGSTASIAKRFYANFIDIVIALAIAAVIYALFIRNRELQEILVPIGYFSYYLLADSFNGGQSFGKKLFEIAVVSRNRRGPCNFLQSFARKTSLLIFSLFDIIFVISKSNRRLGDFIANTEVVDVLPNTRANL